MWASEEGEQLLGSRGREEGKNTSEEASGMKSKYLGILAVMMAGGVLVVSTGCDQLAGVSAEPLRLSTEQPEEGWNYAEGGGVTAACPRSWTLEVTNRRTRAWRCSHPASLESPAGCGLTLYEARRANTLGELAELMEPQIMDYSEESTLVSRERKSLGGQEAEEFVVDQVMNEQPVRAWYRVVLRENVGWLAHCILPEDYVERDEEVVKEIFERISF